MHKNSQWFVFAWFVLAIHLAVAPLVAQATQPRSPSEAEAAGQVPTAQQAPPPGDANRPFGMTEEIGEQSLGTLEIDLHTIFALPLATLLGAGLALRPRRRGSTKRSIQTQIILAIITTGFSEWCGSGDLNPDGIAPTSS